MIRFLRTNHSLRCRGSVAYAIWDNETKMPQRGVYTLAPEDCIIPARYSAYPSFHQFDNLSKREVYTHLRS